ncbi:MAG: hypothetical protein A2Z20_06395 [Bdellovibrionales bacterium RBG_16_40_8]|nr:MAG: hypothetical protein A2Z20_06395 [Bdellovibrionales bacterium RBG_16_40_8]
MTGSFTRWHLLIFIFIMYAIWQWKFSIYQITSVASYKLKYMVKTFNADKNQQLPMLIFLHGSGADEKNMVTHIEETYQFRNPIRTISFRGPAVSGFGYDWAFGSGSNSEQAEKAYSKMLEEVAQSIATSTYELVNKFPTSGKPMIMGFSSGAKLAYYLKFKHSSNFSCIFAINGNLNIANKNERNIATVGAPIFGFHGINDTVVPFASGRAAAQTLKDMGFNAQFIEFDGGHEITSSVFRKIESEMVSSGCNI